MLRRLGNKTRILSQLLELFPGNITTFIDLFMGSGAVTFAMVDRAKYVIANDNDDDIFNLFLVVKDRKAELLDALTMMPYHESLFKYWNTQQEADPIWQAARFLMLSNFGYLGLTECLRFNATPHKKVLMDALKVELSSLESVQMMCVDFREVLKRISWRDSKEQRIAYKEAFIYADPPYLATMNNYAESFTEQDTRDLFDVLTGSGLRFALSEFRHPLVMELVEQHGLYVMSLGERQNLKNRCEELLITNYATNRTQLDLFSQEERK